MPDAMLGTADGKANETDLTSAFVKLKLMRRIDSE